MPNIAAGEEHGVHPHCRGIGLILPGGAVIFSVDDPCRAIPIELIPNHPAMQMRSRPIIVHQDECHRMEVHPCRAAVLCNPCCAAIAGHQDGIGIACYEHGGIPHCMYCSQGYIFRQVYIQNSEAAPSIPSHNQFGVVPHNPARGSVLETYSKPPVTTADGAAFWPRDST